VAPYRRRRTTRSTAAPISLDLLIAEDNPGDARLLEEMLGDLPSVDHDSTVVRTRGEAVEAAGGPREFDLIFLDLGLPDSRGIETVSPVIEAAPDTPIVVLTGHQDVRTASEALGEGVQDYLVKDRVEPEDLVRAIRTALQRHRVEQDLRESEKRFRQMAENIDEIFYLVDLEPDPPELLYLNSAFERIFGIPVHRVYADPRAWRELVHPDDRHRTDELRENLDGGQEEARYRIRRPNGDERVIRERAFSVDEGDGSRRVAGVARDVTDEIELRRSLEEERSQLQNIIDEAPTFMALYMGPEHVLERANEAWFDLVGDRDAVGRPAREIFQEFESQANHDRLHHVYTTGESVRLDREPVEFTTSRDGEPRTRHLNITYQPRVRDGEVVGVIVHGVDVTRLVEAHEKVKAREEDLEAILETAAEGIVFTDSDGRIQYANAAAERIMGLESAEIVRRDVDDVRWGIQDGRGGQIEDRDLPVVRALREGKRVSDSELAIGRPGGGRVILSVNAAPLVGEGDNPEGAVASFRNVTDQKKLERELRHRALHDDLTGLPNRTLFQDRLEQALRRTRRNGRGVAAAYIDLKRFKVVNDSLGHAAGDRVLREVAHRLDGAVREQDTVARYGGDEFTVLLADADEPEEARRAAERLVAALEDPVELGDGAVPVEATVGVALCPDRETADAVDASEFIRRADDAMYEVKDRPGTAYSLAGPSVARRPTRRIEREKELRAALGAGRISTVYQPIFDARTGRLDGVEALARWQHPERGTISPGDFIPLAEETGLVIQLGEQQLEQACRDVLAVESRHENASLELHVNLSARQLLEPNVVDRVAAVLDRTEFPAERLTLEITETAAMRKPDAVEKLHGIGAAIALDDFGTEYSSLAQVKRLQVDSLKIDQSFVSGLPDDHEDRAIVETVLTLGDSLELDVVAEGVETEEQLQVLREAGCGRVQGFLLSRPLEWSGLLARIGERAG